MTQFLKNKWVLRDFLKSSSEREFVPFHGGCYTVKVPSPVCFRLVRYVNLSGSSEDLCFVCTDQWASGQQCKKNGRQKSHNP